MDVSPSHQGSSKGAAMEWMYKGPSALIDREDYLLGRTVDKSLKILEEAEKGNNAFNYAEEVEKDLTPVSIFALRGPAGPVDVIRKIKEDPLYQIQKKEEESLKQLLKNPVKMKQLQQLVEERQASQSKSSKSKKHKKKSKRSHRSSNSDDISSDDASNQVKPKTDIDKLLAAKLSSLKKKLDKSDSESEDEDRRKKRKKEDHSVSNSHSHSSRERHGKERDRTEDRNRDRERYRGFGNSSHHGSRDQDMERRREKDHPAKSSGSSYNSHTSSNNSSGSSHRSQNQQPMRQERKRLDEDELERKRREMMENAKWRDQQRNTNVSKYREDQRKEEETVDKERDPDFIRKQLINAANNGTVEQRIKSNSYNIQRSKHSMNQNFARR